MKINGSLEPSSHQSSIYGWIKTTKKICNYWDIAEHKWLNPIVLIAHFRPKNRLNDNSMDAVMQGHHRLKTFHRLEITHALSMFI